MEYKVSGIIKFGETTKLKLEEKLLFNSPYSSKINISSIDANDLGVELTLFANNEDEAKMKAELEIERISNLLSYFHSVPVREYRISGIVSQTYIPPSQKGIKISEFAQAKVSISAPKILSKESIAILKNNLEKLYPDDFEEIVSLWRQAISQENPGLKYLLLYRLLELLFEKDTQSLTDWIKHFEPQVEMYSDRKRGESTIYTYLRDCIHPKTEHKRFPIEEISNVLPRLQNLVYKRIQEKYGELVS